MTSTIARRLDFSDVSLYAVTGGVKNAHETVNTIQALLDGGVDAVQLRAKTLTDREYVKLGTEIKRRCEAAGALFIVNNRVDLALATNADGIHIGQNDLSVGFIRALIGHRKIIGVSAHSLPQALEAQRAGADYVSCGPLWATPTKPDYPAVGLQLVGLYKAAIKIPFVAIGGIDEQNLDQVVAAGAKTVAVVRALFESADPKATAARMKEKIAAVKV